MKRVYGGQFRSATVEDVDGRERSFMTVWGSLTRDPSENCWSKPRIDFTVRWLKGKKGTPGRFMNCVCWYDNPFYDIAKSLEQGDFVRIDGIFELTRYKNRDGETKEQYSLTVGFLTPAALICNTEAYKAALVDMEQREADKFEGADEDDF